MGATAVQPRTVRVGVYENAPKTFTAPDGTVTGFWPELIRHIAFKGNWQIEWVHGTWDESLQRLSAGEIDILPDMGWTPEHSRKYVFSKGTVLLSRARIYALKADKGSFYYQTLKQYLGTRETSNGRVILPDWANHVLLALAGIALFLLAVWLVSLAQVRRRTRDLRASETKFRSVIAQATEGFSLINEQGLVIEWNHSLEKISGLKASETLGKPICEVMSQRAPLKSSTDEHREQYKTLIRELLETGAVPEQFSSMEWTFPRPDGTTLYLQSNITPIKAEKGYMLCAIIRDITEQKMAKKALQESEERLRTLINATPDIICFKDGHGRWLEANDADLGLFSLTEVDYRGKTDSELAEFTHPIYREAFLTCEVTDEKAWQARGISRGEEIIPKPDGTIKIYDVIKVPVFEADRSKKGLVVLGRDITERKQVEEKIKRSQARLETLHELDGAILEAHSIAAISYAALENLDKLIPAQRTSIALFDETEGKAIIHSRGILENEIGHAQSVPIHAAFPDVESLRAGNMIRLDDLDTLDHLDKVLAQLREAGIRSVLNFPVRSHGMLLGCLNFGFDHTHAFSDEDIAVGQEVADSIAIALEQARLREALQKRASDLVKSLNELQLIYQLSLHIGNSRNVEQVAIEAITAIRQAVQPDVVLFYLLKGKNLKLLAYHTGKTHFIISEAQHHQVGECLCGLTAQTGKTVFSKNIFQDLRCTRNECRNAGLHSFAGLPLLAGDQVIGIIGLGSLSEHDFAAQRSFMETLANEAAVGLQNALLLEELRQHEAELEKHVTERTAELVQANQELESFSYSVSHDLRAPLRAIDGFSRILEEDYGPQLDNEAKRLIGVVRSNTQRMGQLIDDLLAFSRVGRRAMDFSQIDMAQLAHSIFYELTDETQRQRIQLTVQALPTAWGDAALLRQAIMNLLANAVKFSSTRKTPTIEVGFSVENGETVYYVTDNGVGFDMKYAHKLFQIFQRLHSQEEFEGTGVGLSIVQRIITRHGGRVWAEAKPDGGATFYFTLPPGPTNHLA